MQKRICVLVQDNRKAMSKPEASQTLTRPTPHKRPKAGDIVALHEENTKRLHAHIPASLHKKLKLHSVEQDRPLTAIVIDALTAYLD